MRRLEGANDGVDTGVRVNVGAAAAEAEAEEEEADEEGLCCCCFFRGIVGMTDGETEYVCGV